MHILSIIQFPLKLVTAFLQEIQFNGKQKQTPFHYFGHLPFLKEIGQFGMDKVKEVECGGWERGEELHMFSANYFVIILST